MSAWSTAPAVTMLDELPQQTRAVRLRRGLSLREAAAEIGCTHGMVWKVEHGTNVGIDTAILFLSWLDHEEPA